jgi:hypothetical protein
MLLETLGFAWKRRKRHANTSESSGKSGFKELRGPILIRLIDRLVKVTGDDE